MDSPESKQQEALDEFWNHFEADKYFYIPDEYLQVLPCMSFATVDVFATLNGKQKQRVQITVDVKQFAQDIQVIFCDMLNLHYDQNNLDELLKTDLVTAKQCQQCGQWAPAHKLVTYADGWIHKKELKKSYPQTLFQWFKKKVAV